MFQACEKTLQGFGHVTHVKAVEEPLGRDADGELCFTLQ